VRSRPGAARTILLFHIISARPSKQPCMVFRTLGVYKDEKVLFSYLGYEIYGCFFLMPSR